jgi:hypothetical protein
VHDLQRPVPAALQLTSDQSIVGIDGVILPTGIRRREARLLQRHIELPLCGRRLARLSRERLDRGIDAERLQHPQYFRADRIIGTQAAE